LTKDVFGISGELHLRHQLGLEQLVHLGVDAHRRQQVRVEPHAYHRSGAQCTLRGWLEPVDSGGDGRLQRAGHADLTGLLPALVGATLAHQHAAFGEVPHDLLGEEGIARGTLGDGGRQFGYGRIRSQQCGRQRSRFGTAQRGERQRLRAGNARQRSLELGPVGEQKHRLGLRHHRHEVGEHRVADIVDPVHVLDDVDSGRRPGDGRGLHQRGQPAPPGVGVDSRQRPVVVANSEEIVHKHQILFIGAVEPRSELLTCSGGIQAGEPENGAEELARGVERNVSGVRFTEGPEDVGATAGCGD
jgi:hypothetical protein